MEEKKNPNEAAFYSLKVLRQRVKDGTFGEILDDWKWILGYSKRYKLPILFYVVSGILSTTMGLISSVLSKYTIDIITGRQMGRLWVLFTIMVGSTIFGLVFENLLGRISLKLSIRIGNDIQADIFRKIVDGDWSALNQFQSGDILNRFNMDVGTVSSNAVSWLPTIIIAVYRFAATFLVIMHYDWVMAVLSLGAAPAMFLASRVLIRKQREHGKLMRQVGSQKMSFEVETFYNLDTIKSFGIADQFTDKLLAWQQKIKDATLDYNLFTIRTNIFMTLSGTLVSLGTFGYCLHLLWTEAITFGTMTLFLQQTGNLSGSFKSLVGIVPNFLNGSISAHRIRELVELPKEIHVAQSSRLGEKADQGFTLELKDLTYGYLEDQTVVRDAHMVARPGEIVALVGASGEGKTTLVRLLLALIHPQRGTAHIRAADGTELPLNADTRYLIAYVPQGNTILSGTVEENLRMGKQDATEAEMRDALAQACALEFVEKLPQGLQTTLGRRGKGLSEGQAQRLAIARAVLRGAPILLLDEATSALDVATERQVLRNIMQQSPNKTCVVTTHRPSVLNLCDRIYRVTGQSVTELEAEEASRLAIDF